MSSLSWNVVVHCGRKSVKILVTEGGNDVLKAKLPAHPADLLAVMTLLEGLALWHGAKLYAAVYAKPHARDCFERIFYGDGFMPPQSSLVTLVEVPPRTIPYKSRLNNFQSLRALTGIQCEKSR